MISVVVPLYNEGDRVNHLLTHLRQIPGLAEVVLVDASDEPASIAAMVKLADRLDEQTEVDPLVRLVKYPVSGRAAQMNTGAKICSSAILLFLHCDTRLPFTAAEKILQCINTGSVWGRFNVQLDASSMAFRVIETMINLRSRFRHIATGDQAMFVQKEVFVQQHGFADIALMEDVEISQRLKQIAPPALIGEPVLTSARRWQRDGILRTVLLMWKLRLLYWLGRDPDCLATMYRNAR